MILAMSSNRNRSRAGFTLVELVLVIFICALLAALVFPAVRSNWGSLARSTSASDLVRLLRHVRLKSIENATKYEVRLESSNNLKLPVVYEISADGTALRVEKDWARPAGELDAVFVSGHAMPVESMAMVEFENGRILSQAWIIVMDNDKPSAQISISSPSGVVSILPAANNMNIAELTESLRSEGKASEDLARRYWQDNFGKAFD